MDRLIHLNRTVWVFCHSTRKKTTIYASIYAGIFFLKIASLLCRALIPRPVFNTSTESIESSINSHWSFTTFLLYCLQFLVPAQNQSRCVFPTTTQTMMRSNYMNPLLQLRGNFNIILIFALYRYCYRYHYCFCNVLATSWRQCQGFNKWKRYQKKPRSCKFA